MATSSQAICQHHFTFLPLLSHTHLIRRQFSNTGIRSLSAAFQSMQISPRPWHLPKPTVLERIGWSLLPREVGFAAAEYLVSKYLTDREKEIRSRSAAVAMPPIPAEWDVNNHLPKALLLNCIPDCHYDKAIRKWTYELLQKYSVKGLSVLSKENFFFALRENMLYEPQVVVIEAHGTSHSLKFSSGNWQFLNTSDFNLLRDAFKRMPRNSTVVLHSCWSGYGEHRIENIANCFSRAVPQARIVGAKHQVTGTLLQIKSLLPLDIRLKFYVRPHSLTEELFLQQKIIEHLKSSPVTHWRIASAEVIEKLSPHFVHDVTYTTPVFR